MQLGIERVTKMYGRVRVNDEISLSVGAGEVFGLLGPNGAGKTTLVKQIIGLTRPDYGQIMIDGVDTGVTPAFARKATSHLPQSEVPIDTINPIQAIELVGRMRGGGRQDIQRRTTELIEALDIGEWSRIVGSKLSGGVRRLVGFAMAAVVPGKVVMLDEPTNDVDPLRRRLLWRQIEDLAVRGSAVLLVTHNVLEAERSVHRLAMIDHGRVIQIGTPAQFKTDLAGSLRIEVTLEPGAVQPLFPAFLTNLMPVGRRLVATVRADIIPQAMEWAQMLQIQGVVEEFSIGPTSLEDAYVRIIGPTDPDDENQTPNLDLATVA